MEIEEFESKSYEEEEFVFPFVVQAAAM